jgi:hypothetical protein
VDRRVLFAATLAASLAVTAALWLLGIPGFFLFLALPFLFLPRRLGSAGAVSACLACGEAREPGFRFCPRCGAPPR